MNNFKFGNGFNISLNKLGIVMLSIIILVGLFLAVYLKVDICIAGECITAHSNSNTTPTPFASNQSSNSTTQSLLTTNQSSTNQIQLVTNLSQNRFKSPSSVAVNEVGDTIFVLDPVNCHVLEFNSQQQFLEMWGSCGTKEGQFGNSNIGATDLAVDSQNNVYVVDHDNKRVEKFTKDGQFITFLGSLGNGNGQFTDPDGITVDDTDNIYVTDFDINRIVKFNSSGISLATFSPKQLNGPSDVAIDKNGNIFATNWNNGGVVKLNANGDYNTEWYGFKNPAAIAVDGNGNIYVVDATNNFLQKFSNDGTPLSTFPSSNAQQFSSPLGVAVDSNGIIYVAVKDSIEILK